MAEKEKDTAVATNRKAFHDYFIEETIEAGMALQGTEVKSELQRVISGTFAVRCMATMFKKSGTKAIKFADRHPRVAMAGAVLVIVLALLGLAWVARLFV